MKIHRFIGNFDLSKNEVEITNPENIKQIKAVLRMKKGDIIALSDGKGASAEVTIDSISTDKIIGIINKNNKSRTTLDYSKKQVNLYLAILKKENFELAVQKAVECGVTNIIPVITKRTIKTGLNISRLEKIILEASEQSGRSLVPTLSPILKFENALAYGISAEEKIIFHVGENNLYKPNIETKSVSIFIGPEGGFTDNEIKLAKKAGYAVASLGPLTLRGETAAIVATYRVVQGI
jgi:16S rRNA (uracil1498-N3)-methyltransferase